MDQQYYRIPLGHYRQGPGTNYTDNEFYPLKEESVPGSAAMDRGQGFSNISFSTNISDSTVSSELSFYPSLATSSPMSSGEEDSYRIKSERNQYTWDGNDEGMDYSTSVATTQGFQTSMPHPSSYGETAIDPRPTPTSLGWTTHSELLKIYKFVVDKGAKDPYFQLLDGYDVTAQTPAYVFLDCHRAPKKGAYPCQYPWGCSGKQTVFGRLADLERHYKNVHASSDQKDSFRCDYPKCERSSEKVFTRKDHYRDHLRDYHKEDLGSAKRKKHGSDKWTTEQNAWLAERKVSLRWWRCARCLVRRQVQDDGWECPDCKVSCEQERINLRQSHSSH